MSVKMVSFKEAARVAGVTHVHLAILCQGGEIESEIVKETMSGDMEQRVLKQWNINQTSLEAWMAQRS